MYRLILILIFSCCTLFIKSERLKYPIVELERQVEAIMRKYKGIGLSVVLVKDNRIDYSKSFGYNPDYSNPNARDTIRSTDISWIASISKTFIATAIMQLEEKGCLSLDDDVNKYLGFRVSNPYYPDTPITIRMLMCHISSLDGEKVCNNFDLLSPLFNPDFKSFYTDFAPGTNYSYCNIGYNLLGAVIEKVSDQRFDDFIGENIMKPLGLYGGYDITKLDKSRLVWPRYYNLKTKSFLNLKSVYNINNDELNDYVLGYSTPCLYPPGGMKISALDLAKFMLVHMNLGEYGGVRIISAESEKEMRRSQNGKSYGLALAHYNNIISGVELLGMTGGSKGFHTAMFFHPTEKYGFIVVCNGCSSKAVNGIEMNREVVREMYNYLIKE